MDYEQASTLFKERWHKGKAIGKCRFPYDFRYEGDTFILITVPIVTCRLEEVNTATVNKYIDQIVGGVQLDPGWVVYGKRLRNGEVTPFHYRRLRVLDGNHRISARQAIGQFYTQVYIPASNYNLYKRDYDE